jgi:hypothetical protein
MFSEVSARKHVADLPKLLRRLRACHKVSTGKDGTVWKQMTKIEIQGRVQQQNVFKAKAGLTHYCRAVSTPFDALRLIIDEGMMRHIKTCTEAFARSSQPDWKMTDAELDG